MGSFLEDVTHLWALKTHQGSLLHCAGQEQGEEPCRKREPRAQQALGPGNSSS